MSKIADKIVQWARDRNLIEGATPLAQTVKLIEEVGELAGGIARGKPDVIRDSIGDVFVVLTILRAQHGLAPFYPAPKTPVSAVLTAQRAVALLGTTCGRLADQVQMGAIPALIDIRTREMTFDLTNLTTVVGEDFDACVEHAYNEIKDRKGRMVDGVFVRDEG